jgi:hypothetical protein
MQGIQSSVSFYGLDYLHALLRLYLCYIPNPLHFYPFSPSSLRNVPFLIHLSPNIYLHYESCIYYLLFAAILYTLQCVYFTGYCCIAQCILCTAIAHLSLICFNLSLFFPSFTALSSLEIILRQLEIMLFLAFCIL